MSNESMLPALQNAESLATRALSTLPVLALILREFSGDELDDIMRSLSLVCSDLRMAIQRHIAVLIISHNYLGVNYSEIKAKIASKRVLDGLRPYEVRWESAHLTEEDAGTLRNAFQRFLAAVWRCCRPSFAAGPHASSMPTKRLLLPAQMLCAETAALLPRVFPNLRQLTVVEVHRHTAPNVSYGEEEDAARSWDMDPEEASILDWTEQAAAAILRDVFGEPSGAATSGLVNEESAESEISKEALDDDEDPIEAANEAEDLDVWDNLIPAIQILFTSRGRAAPENNTILKLCGDSGELSPHLPRLLAALKGCDKLRELHLNGCINASSCMQLTALTQLTSLHISMCDVEPKRVQRIGVFSSLTSLRELGFAGPVYSGGLHRFSPTLTVLKVDELLSVLPGIIAEEAQQEQQQQEEEGQQGPGPRPGQGHQQQQQQLQGQLSRHPHMLIPLPPGLQMLCTQKVTVCFTSEQLRAIWVAGGVGGGIGGRDQYLFSPLLQQRVANGLLQLRNPPPKLTLVQDEPVQQAPAAVALGAGGDGNGGGGGGGSIPSAQLIRRLLRDVATMNLGNALTLRGVQLSRALYRDLLGCKPEKLVLEPPYGGRPLDGVEALAPCITLHEVMLDATPVFSMDVFDEDDPWVVGLASSLHQLFVHGYCGRAIISYKPEEDAGNLLRNGMERLQDKLQNQSQIQFDIETGQNWMDRVVLTTMVISTRRFPS
ncbi:hypothetical protein Vafri_386 [Volvox africanus]|nr:hypothetical protein Vafri_386 [Volvox africanus]